LISFDSFAGLLQELRTRKGASRFEEERQSIVALIQELRPNRIQPLTLQPVVDFFEKIRSENGETELEDVRRCLLVECLLNNWPEIFSDKYPVPIQEQFERSIKRFWYMCNDAEGWTKHPDNVFMKELAIARQQSVPFGWGIIESFSGFGFRQGLSGNPFQSVRFLTLLFRSRGRRGYYQLHNHTPCHGDFNPVGVHNGYLRLAQLIRQQRFIKGIFGISWLFDPELPRISPELTYQQQLPLKNGATSFFVDSDSSGNALVASKYRMAFYAQGKYSPRNYLMVWPRSALLKWADNQAFVDMSRRQIASLMRSRSFRDGNWDFSTHKKLKN
jgi:hypothetical protein